MRNMIKMGFLEHFQEYNQTLENIFQNIFWNATKHLKIFSFPENILHPTKHSLNQLFDLPWLCVGDFNEILKAHKKMGGKLRPSKQMQDFQDVVECGFVNLGFVGNKFTWCKQTVDGVTVWERLDRALANDEWISLYPASNVIHSKYGTSDHKPLHILPLGILP